jgi:hypothetical protein
MNKALVAAAVAALGLAACQQDGSWPEAEETGSTTEGAELTTRSPTLVSTVSKLEPAAARAVEVCLKGYNPLDHHLAALGTAVLKCKKSIGPEDFVITEHPRDPNKRAVLQRNFDCGNKEANRDIDNLLGLQLLDYARAYPYFNNQWETFLRRYKRAGSPVCPLWEHLQEDTAPSEATVKEFFNVPREVKSHNTWQLHPDNSASCQDPSCLVKTAQLCTSWLGVRFWETADVEKGIVRTDPSWWKDNTNYGSPDFFDSPLVWTHRMATDTGWPPGDLYGAPARWGEQCTYYSGDMLTVMNGYLYPIQCSPGWWCATWCTNIGSLPVKAPVQEY